MIIPIPLGLASLNRELEPLVQPSEKLQTSLNVNDLFAMSIRGGGHYVRDWVIELQTRRGTIEIGYADPDFDPLYDWIDQALDVDMTEMLSIANNKSIDPAPKPWCEVIWQSRINPQQTVLE